MKCLQCGYTPEEANDDVTFHELNDSSYWCSACRSLMEGWKETDDFMVLINDKLPSERQDEIKSRVRECFSELAHKDHKEVNAEAGEA